MFQNPHFIVLIVLFLCSSVRAESPDLGFRFEREYSHAWKRLEDVYSRMELIEEHQPQERIRDGKEPIRISYMADGIRYRMDVDTPGVGTLVSVASDSICFRLERPSAQAEFVVKDINRHAFRKIRESMPLSGHLAFAPYSIMDMRLFDFLTQKDFKNEGYEVVPSDGDPLLKLKWRSPYVDHEGKPQVRVGWFLFSADSWTLREYEYRYSEAAFGAVRARIEYEGVQDGIPLVKSMTKWAERRDGTTEPRMTSKVIYLSPKAPSPENFTLSAFNLPDDLGTEGKLAMSRFWLVIVGLGGLVVSWLLVAWIRKRQGLDS